MLLRLHILPLLVASFARAIDLPDQHEPNIQPSSLLPVNIVGPFTMNSTGEIAGQVGIEHRGLGKIIFNTYRPIDAFILRGDMLVSVNRLGSCYVEPDAAHLYCGDIPVNVPHNSTKFGIAANGTLLFKGSAHWWACPSQNPNSFDIHFADRRKPTPYCKATQLNIRREIKQRRSAAPMNSATPAQNGKPFALTFEPDTLMDHKQKAKFGPFWIDGKSLRAGDHHVHYCVVEYTTRRLLCPAGKDSTVLIDNFHTINFSLSKDNMLQYDNSDIWFICSDEKGGWIGPFDFSKKETDPNCRSSLREVRLKAIETEFDKAAVWKRPKDAQFFSKFLGTREDIM